MGLEGADLKRWGFVCPLAPRLNFPKETGFSAFNLPRGTFFIALIQFHHHFLKEGMFLFSLNTQK